MTLITETVTINSKNYKHIYSDAGYYVKRNDNKLFMDVLEPTSSTYTYTETTQLATQQLLSRMMARMSTLETKHNNLEGLPHVVETYSNGTDWYRVYSDKWCEQGGWFASTASGDSYVTVNLHKPYRDKNYTIRNQQCQSGTTLNWGAGCACIRTPATYCTTSSFVLSVDACTNTTGYFWNTSGYIS